MSMDCFGCVKIPTTNLLALRGIAHKVKEIEHEAMIKALTVDVRRCIRRTGWTEPLTTAQRMAFNVVETLMNIRKKSIFRWATDKETRLLRKVCEVACEDTDSGEEAEILLSSTFFIESFPPSGPLFNIMEYLSQNRSLTFLPAANGTFCKWNSGQLSSATEAWLYAHFEEYEFCTGTDGDYEPACPTSFREWADEEIQDERTREMAIYRAGNVVAEEKRKEFTAAIGNNRSISMSGLSFDIFGFCVEDEMFILKCAIAEAVKAEKEAAQNGAQEEQNENT